MSRAAVRRVVSVVGVALLLVGCVPEEPESERPSLDELRAQVEEADAAAEADGEGHDHGDHDHGEEAEVSGEGSSEEPAEDAAEPTAAATPAPSASPEAAATQGSDEPAGPVMEQHDDFPITATLSAACVEQGGEMTLTVDTGEEKTGVVYLAYYAGGESGAPPPYGEGHGGNDGDLVDEDGRYQDTWVVSASAPVGPARVEVKAGRGRGEESTAVVRFEVVEAGGGGCGGG